MKPIVLNSISIESLIAACDGANEEGNDIIIRLVDEGCCNSLYEVLAVFDYINQVRDTLKAEIHFELIGMINCLEILPMLACRPSNRRISERSMMRWFTPTGFSFGTAEEAKLEIEARLTFVERIKDIFVENTEMSKDEVTELMEREVFSGLVDLDGFGFLGA